jgi:hypothetical protein
MAWIRKGTRGPPLSVLRSFYKQRVLMALQRVQVTSILRWAIIVGEGSSRLGILLGLPTLSLVDMLDATNGGFDT